MRSTRSRCSLAIAAVLFVTAALTARPAHAHFILQGPACWMSQDVAGLPQKLGPCGDEGGGTATGTISAFQAGQTITVTINEVIFHPGHYRIALAVHDRSELPAEPTVTPGDMYACGSAPVQNPPVFPVLADGVFDHDQPFTEPQSITVKLPDNVTCDKCTLQVIEFMGEHQLNDPGGCYYHHCADISIQASAVTVDGGGAGGGGGTSGTAPVKHGSGCSVAAGAASSAGAALFCLALLALGARRRPS